MAANSPTVGMAGFQGIPCAASEFTSFIIIHSKYSMQLTIAPCLSHPHPRALYEEVAELLRQRIFRRELEPGCWIDELKIAEEFGISCTPARGPEGTRRRGLVTMKVRRGAYVTEMSERTCATSTTAQPARKRCCRRGGAYRQCRRPAHARAIARRTGSRPGSATGSFAINERFHMRLLELSDNRWRSQMVADLRKVMKLNRHNSLLKQGRSTTRCANTAPSWPHCWPATRTRRCRPCKAISPTAWKPPPEFARRAARGGNLPAGSSIEQAETTGESAGVPML